MTSSESTALGSRLSQADKHFTSRFYISRVTGIWGKSQTAIPCLDSKEAVSKVLGTRLSIGSLNRITCHDIQIHYHRGIDHPKVVLMAEARQVAKDLGVSAMVLSWHHNHHLACANVVGAEANTATAELRTLLKETLRSLLGD